MNATPRPWELRKVKTATFLEHKSGAIIPGPGCYGQISITAELLEHISRAVNSYDAMREALGIAVKGAALVCYKQSDIDKMKAALALAKEKG